MDKPPPPSRLKEWFDWNAVPAAIDAAATVEAGFERVAVATRQCPVISALCGHGHGRIGLSDK